MTEKLKIDLSLLSKYRTELMGFSAIGILMCHACGNNVAMPSVLWQIFSLGQIGVSIFFLLSGMGMYYSLKKTQCGEVIDWYKSRYIKLLLPYLLMAIPYFLWVDIAQNQSIVNFLLHITTVSFWIQGSGVWFVGAIIPLYLIIPWWHRWLSGIKLSWVPTLIIFIALICIGQWRHMGEVAFFFLGYWLGKPVSERRKIVTLLWVVLPMALYVACRMIPSFDFVPRSLLLVVPFLFMAAVFFDKVGHFVKVPFQFLGKISLESYMANVMLPSVFALVPWVIYGVNYNAGNRLLYFCVVVFGIFMAFVVHSLAQPMISKLLSSTK
jgi:hypothetical protein